MTTPTDILRQAISAQLINVHTSFPATILSYDYTKQKANLQPSLKRKYKNGEIISLPVLTNVPVVFPRTANFSIHFPLNEGDRVLVFCCERSLDQWLSNGNNEAPLDSRKFSLSDAMAIPGLYPFSETSPAEDNQNFILKFENSKLKISPTGTLCFHGQSEELMSILDELFTAIENITIAADQGGVPNPTIPINNLATFTLLQSRFNTLKGTC